MSERHHDIVIVGGGTAGITTAARLLASDPGLDVLILDPTQTHYYQPIWTLVGGGVFDKTCSARPQADVIPPGATWVASAVDTFEPDARVVVADDGTRYHYDQLVVAAGIQLDWDRIEGLAGNVGKHGICSNYTYDTVDSTWQALRSLRSGRALCTMPQGAMKCGGAPQKIMWLIDHHLRRQGRRDAVEVCFASAGEAIFGVPKYRRALERLVEARDIHTMFRHDLVAVRPEARQAVFEHLDTGERTTVGYDMLHVVPPQSAPDFIKRSPLAADTGWVDVDKHTLQHVRYPEVFSLGDCSSLPCSKTGAAVRKQAPVLVANLLARRAGRPLEASYGGYSSCPLITGYGRLILAEFDYSGEPCETFPFDQARERYSMYVLKAYGLPEMYWNGMLRGHV